MPDLEKIERERSVGRFTEIARFIPAEVGIRGIDPFIPSDSWEPPEPHQSIAPYVFDHYYSTLVIGRPNGAIFFGKWDDGLTEANKDDFASFVLDVDTIEFGDLDSEAFPINITVPRGESGWYFAVRFANGNRAVWKVRIGFGNRLLLGDAVASVPNAMGSAPKDDSEETVVAWLFNDLVQPQGNIRDATVTMPRSERDIWFSSEESLGAFSIDIGRANIERVRQFTIRHFADIRIGDYIRQRVDDFTYYWRINEISDIGRNRFLNLSCQLVAQEEGARIALSSDIGILSWVHNQNRRQVLPEASGGVAPYTYEVLGLTAGLMFDTKTRILSGRIADTGITQLTYVARDSQDRSISLVFFISVTAVPIARLAWNIGSISTSDWAVDAMISDIVLPAATGASGGTTYSAAGLPTGLMFDATTRTISGTPTASGSGTIRLTVRDDLGRSIERTIDYDIPKPASTAMWDPTSISTVARKWRVGTPIADIVVPAATGGTESFLYTVTGWTAAGLSYDAKTRTLSGTPSSVVASDDVVIRVIERVDISVDPTGMREIGRVTIPYEVVAALSWGVDETAREFLKDEKISDIVLPAAAGGYTPFTYSAASLPEGLAFDAATRTISGTPTKEESGTAIFTATDKEGGKITARWTFSVTAPATVPASTDFWQWSTTQSSPTAKQVRDGRIAATKGSATITLVTDSNRVALGFESGDVGKYAMDTGQNSISNAATGSAWGVIYASPAGLDWVADGEKRIVAFRFSTSGNLRRVSISAHVQDDNDFMSRRLVSGASPSSAGLTTFRHVLLLEAE